VWDGASVWCGCEWGVCVRANVYIRKYADVCKVLENMGWFVPQVSPFSQPH